MNSNVTATLQAHTEQLQTYREKELLANDRSSQLNDDELKELDESDSSQTIRELAKHMGASMVLSPNVAKPPDQGRPPNHSARSTTPTSTSQRKPTVLYSKVHERPAVTRESLLHPPSSATSRPSSNTVDLHTTAPNTAQPVIIETTYWGVSQSPGSIFFDVTSRRESDRDLYKLAFYQLKEYVGLVVHKSGPNRYLEVNFDIEEFRILACNEGLRFDNGLVVIRPVVACRPGSIIKRVTLQRLPWLRPQRLLEGLRSTLGNYGNVRDVGIVTDSDTGAFLGSGYAVLDCSPSPNQTDPFLELTHAIESVDPASSEDLSSIFIHAYWKDMPTYCKYCHKLGHSAVQCKEAPSNKRTCFYCFKPGHIRAQCPDKVVLGKRRKANPSSSTLPAVTSPIAESNTDVTGSTTMAANSLSVEVSSNTLIVNEDDECSDPVTAPTGFTKDPSADLTPTTEQRSFESSNRSIYAPPVKETEDSGSSALGEDMILTDLTQLNELPAELDISHELMDTCSDEDLPDPSSNIKDTRGSTAPIDRRIPPGTLLRSYNNRKAYTLLSLNDNNLFKVSNPSSRKHLIRYIRSHSPTFVALQEIDNSSSNNNHLHLLHQQFCSHQSLWTRYCGLLCFDSQYTLTRIPLPEDARRILTKVSHINGQMAPFHILVVYAPASSRRDRQEFFDTLLTFQQLSPNDPDSCVDRMIIAGDFNYTLKPQVLSSRSSVSSRWLQFVQCHFKNVMTELSLIDTPTFRRGSSTQSIIDYIYVSLDLSVNFVEADVEFINPAWTDHALFQMTLKTDFQFNTGPGIWRANPIYAGIKEYRQQLANMLTNLYNQEIENSPLAPQDLWDLVKSQVQIFTRRLGRKRVDWRKQQIVALQKKRQRLLRGSLPTSLLAIHLPRVEQQIQTLQQEVSSIAILKAERHWRERGETDAGYLKKSAAQRTVQRSIPPLRDPETQNICSTQDQMLEITEKFYMNLYTADPICPSALDSMVSHIPRSCCLSTEDSKLISSPFVKNDILEQVKRTPKVSSPGTDGLSYSRWTNCPSV
ncbi:hypothetical protein G6F43_010143 [Rhizopus delemar]|nr:hypothetical protein G6F43_010143 [Rhizopus delemar]